jgi:thioesterase domain-containing protein
MKCKNELEANSSENKSASVAQDTQVYPRWFCEQRHWVEDPLHSDSAVYNFPLSLRIEGRLDHQALHRTLNEIVRRHEILRSVFLVVDGELLQSIAPPAPLELPTIDLSHLPKEQAAARAFDIAKQETIKPFDFGGKPILRATLLRIGQQDHILALVTNHLVFDDWSVGVFTREFVILYQCHSSDQPSPLPEITFQYSDFLRWQKKTLQGQALNSRLAFWRRQSAGADDFHHLSTDHPRPAVRTTHGGWESLAIASQLAIGLRLLGQREGVTLFMTLLAAFQALLYRYSGNGDIGVGTCAANRTHVEVEGLIGRFGNDLVLRTHVSDDPNFRELLKRVRRTALEGFAYQDLPFGQLVDKLVPVRDRSRNPIFQVMFILRDAPKDALSIPGLKLSWLPLDLGTTKYDVSVWVDIKEGVEIGFEYNRDLFEPATIQRLAESYRTILETVVADPNLSLSTLSISPKVSQTIQPEVVPEEVSYLEPRNPLETQLVRLWGSVFQGRVIGIRDNFFELGGGSLIAAQLCRRIERALDTKLSIAAIFEAPTIEELALVLNSSDSAERPIKVVPLQRRGSRPPFFCVCIFVGSGPIFLPLTRYLGNDQPFLGLIPSEVLSHHLSPPYRLVDVAQQIVATIRKQQPHGPYFLGGFCGDGVLAFETARLLRTEGQEVSFLALFEAQTRDHQKQFTTKGRQIVSIAGRFTLRQLRRHAGNLWQADWEKARRYLFSRSRELIREFKDILWQASIDWNIWLHRGILRNMRQILFVAEKGYVPRLYDGDVALFRCTDYRQSASQDLYGGWQASVSGSLKLHQIQGDHLGILDEPNVKTLAQILSQCLQEAQERGQGSRSESTYTSDRQEAGAITGPA